MQTAITKAPGQPTPPVHLPVETAKANARAAYLARALQMQQPGARGRAGSRYLSDDGKWRCAIGVSLTETDARRFDKFGTGGGSASVARLIDRGLITTDHKATLIRLQQLHDVQAHADFRQLVGITDAEVTA